MCIEIPSKVILVKAKKAKVKQGARSFWVDISSMGEEVKGGDYLITYRQVAINKVPLREVKKILHLIGNLEESQH